VNNSDGIEPFHLSRVLARLLRAHARLREWDPTGDGEPSFFLDKVRTLRDQQLDELLSLMPEEVLEGGRREVTADCVLQALRSDVLLDICHSPLAQEAVEEVASVAFGGPSSQSGVYRARPLLLDDSVHEGEV
jgi:hypothetical protein